MSDHTITLIRLAIEAVLAAVIIVLMVWIVVEPSVNDEATKAALVIVSSTVGFLFGRHNK